MPGVTKRPDFSDPQYRGSPQYAGASAMFPATTKEVSTPGVTRRPDFSDPQYRGSPQYTGASALNPITAKEVSAPGVTKRPDFSDPQYRGSPQYTGASAMVHLRQHSPSKKTVRLAENPHVSAFLSPKSRMFTGGHSYPGVPARGESASTGAFSTSSSNTVGIAGKQLTPDEVAQKIASMLKPGPPFFSRVSNADLLDFISDSSIMNCEKLREQAELLEAKKAASRATAAFVPSGTVVRRRAEEERWAGVGTVWSSLDGLPAGASFGRIPGEEGITTQSSQQDDGLWNAITLSCDIDCTNVTLAKSVVVPTEVLQHNNFFNGNAQSLFDDIGAGVKYKFDNLVGKASGKSSKPTTPTTANGGSKITPNYLSLSAYTDPTAFSATSFELKWPSWMHWGKKSTTSPTEGTPTTTAPASGGQKRVWVPSSSKVSIHATWWGYNLYLPQPILDKLDGDVDEAEKVANLINKCLTYILNNVPAGLPSSFAAVVVILKAIAPTTGYISTFIGWSWDTIKSFNKGQGVVLSATWILPVALIPRAWDAPANPVASSPATPTTGSAPTLPVTPAAPVDSTAPVATPTPVTGGNTSSSTPTASVPSTTTRSTSAPAVAGTGTPMTAQDVVNDPENTPLPDPTIPAVAAPGATLPPANPSTVSLDLAPPPTNDTTQAVYPGDARGRGGDQSTAAPMGKTPAPAGQTPIDAVS